MIYFENSLIGSAYKFAEQIRAKGFNAELSLFEEKEKTLIYAEQKGIDKMICILEDDKIQLIDVKSKNSLKTSTEKFIKGLDMFINILGE